MTNMVEEENYDEKDNNDGFDDSEDQVDELKMDNEREKNHRRECAECHKVLGLGFDAIAAQQGVIGPSGFVDLEDPLHFCSDGCVSRYFNEHKPEKVPRRIP